MENSGHHLTKPLALELYTSSNFMGFFVEENDANYLKRLALQYVKEISHSSKFWQIFRDIWLKFNLRIRANIKIFCTNLLLSVISDTYENLDALITCFPWCSGISSGVQSSRCIPKSSRCKKFDSFLGIILKFSFRILVFPSTPTLLNSDGSQKNVKEKKRF